MNQTIQNKVHVNKSIKKQYSIIYRVYKKNRGYVLIMYKKQGELKDKHYPCAKIMHDEPSQSVQLCHLLVGVSFYPQKGKT